MKTRRAFLQTASAFAAGGLLLPSLLKAGTTATKNDGYFLIFS